MGKSTLLLQALGQHGRAGRPLPARHRRGVERAGAAAGRAARRARGQPARRRRDLAAARRRARRIGRGPTCWRSTRSRPSSIPTFPARRVRSPRCATARTGSCSRRRNASWPPCSSATSRRKAPSPGRGCSSTSSTPCSRSTAIADTRCACCTRSKHRFGSTDELGLFEMTEPRPRRRARRVVALPRRPPRRRARLRGGRRCSKARVRCSSRCRRWSCPTGAPMPRRSAAGIDPARLAMLLAVLDQHARGRARRRPTCTRASPAGCGSPRPASTSRSRSRSASARREATGRRRHGRGRRGRPRRRDPLGAAARPATRRSGALGSARWSRRRRPRASRLDRRGRRARRDAGAAGRSRRTTHVSDSVGAPRPRSRRSARAGASRDRKP